MAYVTTQTLIERYGSAMLIDLTDRDTPATGAVVQAVVDRAVTNTAAVIDGYLANVTTLPVVEVPALLADLAEVIAIYKLHPYQPAEKIAADYKHAMQQLKMISEGTIKLPLPDGSEIEGKDGTGAQMSDRDRPFTADKMKGLI